MSIVERPLPLAISDPWPLLDALLYSVSHDLRSPLLGLTLSADLLNDPAGVTDGNTRDIALDGLRHGARDMERMLQALTVISRARRRVFEHDHGTLGMILGGHLVMSDVDQLAGRVVLVDPVTVRELLDEVVGDGPVEVRVSLQDGLAVLSAPVNVDLPPFEGRPLHALASSLQSYAGSAVEPLAASQVLLDRQGAGFSVEDGRILLWLPLEDSR
ncbi:MAG: hypothetical protein C4558_10065 [Dehalococcoidia bacterium]|nr:MAG: hypothetical protein C4558_10065 [Dehalococcoidia bacterium]